MPYNKITLAMNPGQSVRAQVTFPEDCYTNAGGAEEVPNGHSIPPNTYGYTIFFRKGPNCNAGDTNVSWTIPFTPDQGGKIIHVFLVNKSTGDTEDEEEGAMPVKPG